MNGKTAMCTSCSDEDESSSVQLASSSSSRVRMLSLSSMHNELEIRATECGKIDDPSSQADGDGKALRPCDSLREMAMRVLYGKNFIPKLLDKIKISLRNGYLRSQANGIRVLDKSTGNIVIKHSNETLDELSRVLEGSTRLMLILAKITKCMCVNSMLASKMNATEFDQLNSRVLTDEELRILIHEMERIAHTSDRSCSCNCNCVRHRLPVSSTEDEPPSSDLYSDASSTHVASSSCTGSSIHDDDSSLTHSDDLMSSTAEHDETSISTDENAYEEMVFDCADDDGVTTDDCNGCINEVRKDCAEEAENDALHPVAVLNTEESGTDDLEELGSHMDSGQMGDDEFVESLEVEDYRDDIPYIAHEDSGIHCWDSTLSTTDDEAATSQ